MLMTKDGVKYSNVNHLYYLFTQLESVNESQDIEHGYYTIRMQ